MTMARIMLTVAQLLSPGSASTMSVNTDITASASSTSVKGFIKADASLPAVLSFLP